MNWHRLVVKKYATFRQFSVMQRRLLLQATALLPLTALTVRLMGFNRSYRALHKFFPIGDTTPPSAEQALARIRTTKQMVRLATRRGLGRANCLTRSLVLWWLLRRQGIACDLRIGARKDAGVFEAHAWVEHVGWVLNDRYDIEQHYTPFARTMISSELALTESQSRGGNQRKTPEISD